MRASLLSSFKIAVMGFIVAFVLGGCEQLGDDSRDSTVNSIAEAALTTINGMLDESADEGFASLPAPWSIRLARLAEDKFGIPSAWAAACSSRASAQTCVTAPTGGTRTRTYDSCSLANTQFTMQGTVTLTYNDEACLYEDEDTITRTTDLRRTGPFGGYTQTTTEAHTAYDGTAISAGGTQLKKVLVGHEVSVIGVHKRRFNSKGDKIYDLSLRTMTPMASSGLTRSTREITGGRIRVYHNMANYTAELVVSETLRYSSGCCYPKEGKLTYAAVGSVAEQGSVAFTSCGKGSIKTGNTETAFTYASCE